MEAIFILLMFVSYVCGGPATDTYKDQYCTDPRTMRKHAAYTEWADAYSCTRHRCQPGGRNLAIYTVGCKRVEAPESAIECEEVVEDTNMQFPYCCTRLRCLVVVRGEVWTRVLGQPWEVLPAAPWSHMYKMKKPPPSDTPFQSKTPEQGPVYELAEPEKQNPREKVLRAGKKVTTVAPDCNDVAQRSVPAPDIVIALSTNSDKKERKKKEHVRHKRVRKTLQTSRPLLEEDHKKKEEFGEDDEPMVVTEKPLEPNSEERFRNGVFGVTRKSTEVQQHQVTWTEIPQNQWHDDHEMSADPETLKDVPTQGNEKKEEKPSNLQALVDAIGTRMRDIENVVQRMSEKVHHDKPADTEATSLEKRSSIETHNLHKENNKETEKAKKPSPGADNYKRFSVRNRGSKYVHSTADVTTDQSLYAEDTNMNGYFSDASNSVLRRASPPKISEPAVSAIQSHQQTLTQPTQYTPGHDIQSSIGSEPAAIYMAPVESRRKTPAHIIVSDSSDEGDKKRKKHASHKKKHGKGHSHKKHRKDDKRKRFNRLTSIETDKNAVSLEDSGAVASK